MKTLLSCEFNMDTGCVELRYSDDSMISINCTAVEDEVANSRFQRSELNWLIYNDPLSYAELILNGDPEKYLRSISEKCDRVQAAGLNNEIADVSEQRLHRRFHFIVLDKISIILLFSYSLYFEGVNP